MAARGLRLSSLRLPLQLPLLFLGLLPDRGDAIMKEAVEHVKCEICEMAVEAASSYAKENAINDEDGLNDMMEGLCSVKKKEGRWVSRLDIVREDEDAQLTVQRMDTPGFCKNECLTVQRACQASVDSKADDFVSWLLKGKSVKEMKKKLCKKICSKAVPKLGKKWKDEPFEERDAKEMETEDMIEKMRAETGMGMKMYKREDLLSMSEGDMETMAAREAFSSERAAARMADQEL
mmetsp:Transcript_128660/g.320906  ORF Transcript_128660/g.320906 Transcript_128660/m.320906 type:complete len:235 (+) Transcript_128660:84-788(+)